jgi:translation initiation factor IF-2
LVATLVADQARAARDGATLLEQAHASGAAKAAPTSPAASDMWPPPPPGSRKLIDTWRKNGEAPASPESPATVPESDSDAPLEAAEAPDPTPAPAPATRPQGISNNDDAPAWAHSPTGDHSPRARRNAWGGAASTSGLPSWASTPPTEPEPSWAEDGIRPPKV